ncbi:MAG: 16S rRNA (uracil(1498)-N(3))-methyltransferase [Lachnospiraceae bacterium]|nr:16S rRNA (uracil(1498)-N(3))-methyltransferase [Lachnospiraceae bacterium]
MHFFTDDDLTGAEKVYLDEGNTHHLVHVLRADIGDKIEVSDACGRTYACTILETEDKTAVCSVDHEIKSNRELSCDITLFQSIAKGEKMDWVIQKAVELGATRIVPMITGRTIVRPDPKGASHKVQRWSRIAESAAKQCGRAVIPEISEVTMFPEAVSQASSCDWFIFPYECAEGMAYSREIFGSIQPGSTVSVMIGPEGGFEPSEVSEAKRSGAHILTLGNRILRTETAALTALSWLVYQLEESGNIG